VEHVPPPFMTTLLTVTIYTCFTPLPGCAVVRWQMVSL